MSEQDRKLKAWAESIDKQQMKLFLDFVKDAGYDHTLIFKHEINNYDFQSGETIAALRGYKAATAEANKRMAELESEVAELKVQIEGLIESGSAAMTSLKASNHDLREALEGLLKYFTRIPSTLKDTEARIKAHKALSTTPAESLVKHDNEVIERCAEAIGRIMVNYEWVGFVTDEIRALKGTK